MAFKATKYFVAIAALVMAGTRYMNTNRKRVNFNAEISIWDTEAKDGQRFTIVTRSNETDGQYFVGHIYCTAKAQGFYPGKPCSSPLLIHESQDKELEVISGVLMLDLNGTKFQVLVGEKQTVPAGTPHTYWNGGGSEEVPLELWIRLSPGRPDEGFWEMTAALSYQFGGLGKVNPMQLVLLFSDYGMTLAELPQPLWIAARKFLVPMARVLGFKSHYPEYASRAGQPQPAGAQAAAAALEWEAAAAAGPEAAVASAEAARGTGVEAAAATEGLSPLQGNVEGASDGEAEGEGVGQAWETNQRQDEEADVKSEL